MKNTLQLAVCLAATVALGCSGDDSVSSESSGSSGATAGAGSTGTTSGATGSGGAAPTLPEFVQLEILDAAVYPSPKGGQCWDGACSISQEDLNALAVELAKTGDPYAIALAVAAVLGGIVNEAGSPPDPIATATIWGSQGFGSALSLAKWGYNYSDTYTPTWKGDEAYGNAKGWTDVPLNSELRVRIDILDTENIGDADDPIGVVELNYDDVVDAYLAKQSYPVRVDDQGSGLVLFVGISVNGL